MKPKFKKFKNNFMKKKMVKPKNKLKIIDKS